MNIYVAGLSALEYWAWLAVEDGRVHRDACPIAGRMGEWGLRPARVRTLATEVPSDDELRERLGSCMPRCPERAHILVGSGAARRRGDGKVCHVWTKPIAPDSFAGLGNGVYVSTPEFAFRQLAYGRGYPLLLRLGYELCAAYLCSETDARGFRPCTPITSAERIRAYCSAAASGDRGLERLAPVVRRIADGAASPRETDTAVRLCAPRTKGGLSFPLPELNGRVDLPGTNGGFYRCDLLWRDRMLAVEYDSDAFHLTAQRHTSDSVRRNALIDMGYTVITVTNGQYRDPGAFLDLGGQIARALGVKGPTRAPGYDWPARYSGLFDALRVRGDVFSGAL